MEHKGTERKQACCLLFLPPACSGIGSMLCDALYHACLPKPSVWCCFTRADSRGNTFMLAGSRTSVLTKSRALSPLPSQLSQHQGLEKLSSCPHFPNRTEIWRSNQGKRKSGFPCAVTSVDGESPPSAAMEGVQQGRRATRLAKVLL